MRVLRNGIVIGALGCALLLGAPGAPGAQDASDVQYSEAQIALFQTPHLDNIEQPVTVEYDYRREAGPDESFVDTVAMTVTAISSDGGKDVTFEYLTGSNRRPFGDVTDFRGNPLIMVFLEDDLQRMMKKLGGGGVYMRNRIRNAFLDRGKTQPITFDLNGRTVEGTRITVAPFVGDKNRERLGEYEHKVYEFVISPEVPGGIFQMRGMVLSPGSAGKPLAQDTLTYRGIHP